jgi:hypothetical protein
MTGSHVTQHGKRTRAASSQMQYMRRQKQRQTQRRPIRKRDSVPGWDWGTLRDLRLKSAPPRDTVQSAVLGARASLLLTGAVEASALWPVACTQHCATLLQQHVAEVADHPVYTAALRPPPPPPPPTPHPPPHPPPPPPPHPPPPPPPHPLTHPRTHARTHTRTHARHAQARTHARLRAYTHGGQGKWSRRMHARPHAQRAAEAHSLGEDDALGRRLQGASQEHEAKQPPGAALPPHPPDRTRCPAPALARTQSAPRGGVPPQAMPRRSRLGDRGARF